MKKHTKVLVLIILVTPWLMCAQTDTLKIKTNTAPPIQIVLDSVSNAKLTDTINNAVTNNSKTKGTPDVLLLTNGDVLTGKIISFEQGRLKFDAQGPGVVYIKWYKIKSIRGGSMIFRVENDKGEIFKGRIIESLNPAEITVLSIPKQDIKIVNVNRIFPLEEKWYKGFKGTIGGGLSYNKSSDVLQVNGESNIYYVIERWRFVNSFSYISTSTNASDFSERIQFNLQEFYALKKKWFLYEQNSFNRNDELGINAKVSFGAGAGNNLALTEIQKFQAYSGILQNFESNIQNDSFSSDVEWQFTLHHYIYSFLNPNITATTFVSGFLGITEQGRYRVDASTNLTWEFVQNFKLQLSFYYNYDNKIIQGKNTQKDYGYTLSLLLDLK